MRVGESVVLMARPSGKEKKRINLVARRFTSVAMIQLPAPEEVVGDCPHCCKGVKFIVHRPDAYAVAKNGLMEAADAVSAALRRRDYRLRTYDCPLCDGLCVDLIKRRPSLATLTSPGGDPEEEVIRLFPRDVTHEPPPEVTSEQIRRDYSEAHACIPVSKRGAAALARRALQQALRDKGFTHSSKKLVNEIELASKSPDVPSTLREKLHFIREVGNDAAHPNYNRAGEVVNVTDDELAMLLESLDEVFDVFYVRPARHKAVMDARKAHVKGTT
jgi:hypothetical protein